MGDGAGKITFVDTTLRDGPQSLWSLSMRTGMMTPIAETIDDAGYRAVEVMSTAEFKKCVRDLREDPWERLRQLRNRIRKTPRRFICGRHMNTFQIEPETVARLWTERLAANGVQQMRISDCSNTAACWRKRVDLAREYGIGAVVNLIYSLSPRHTDEYYAEKTCQAARLRPDGLCLKDPGALITPERVKTLVPVIRANANGLPVEFHTHCVTGLGPLCYFEAIRLGITCVNTAVPPLADGSSNPSIFNVIANARAIGIEPRINEPALERISKHFFAVAEREGFPVGRPRAYDYSQYLHQVPGGMISNFRYQLAKVGMEDRLPAVLEETARVREELGHPIMVTPYSQFVGTQAAMNVIVGERYKIVPDEVIFYALGFWGEEERELIDPDIRDRILASPRAAELAKYQLPEPTLDEVRARYGGPGVSDDDVLLRLASDKESVDAMRAAPPVINGSRLPLVQLIETLDRNSSCRYVYVGKTGTSVTLARRPSAP